jgi:hypothetical protein
MLYIFDVSEIETTTICKWLVAMRWETFIFFLFCCLWKLQGLKKSVLLFSVLHQKWGWKIRSLPLHREIETHLNILPTSPIIFISITILRLSVQIRCHQFKLVSSDEISLETEHAKIEVTAAGSVSSSKRGINKFYYFLDLLTTLFQLRRLYNIHWDAMGWNVIPFCDIRIEDTS